MTLPSALVTLYNVSPIAYSDYYKRQVDLATKMKASSTKTIRGTDNKYLYTINGVENLTEQDIWESASKSMTEEDRGQMFRDATYHYKSATDDQILNEFTEANTRKLTQLKYARDNAAAIYGVTAPEEKEKLEKQINEYNTRINQTKSEVGKALVGNRDATVGKLFEQRFLEGLSKRFSYRKEDIKPFWDQGLIHKENLEQKESQFGRRLNFDAQKENNDVIQDKRDYELAVRKQNHEESKDTLSDGSKVDLSTEFINSSSSKDVEPNTSEILRQSNTELKQAKDNITQSFYDTYAINHDGKDSGMFTLKDGHYIPTDKWKQANPKLVKGAQDIANGRPTEINSLPEEFIEHQKEIKELEVRQKINQNKLNSISSEYMTRTKAELQASGKNLTDDEWKMYEQGRKIHEAARSRSEGNQYIVTQGGETRLKTNEEKIQVEYSKLSGADRKAYDLFKSKVDSIDPIVTKYRKAVESDLSNRENYIGVTFNAKQSKSVGLMNGIYAQSNGYYVMNGQNGLVENNETEKPIITSDNFEPVGQIKSKMANGKLGNFVIGNLTLKDGTTNITKRIYIPIDDKINQSLATGIQSPSGHLKELIDTDPYHEYVGQSYATPVKGRVGGEGSVVDYRIVRPKDGEYRVQIKQPYKEDGTPLDKPVWVPISTRFTDVDMAYKMADDLSQSYQQQVQLYKAQGKKLSFKEFVQKHP